MPDYFCAGCRVEMHTDHLRADADGYYYCEKCAPGLFQDGTRRHTRPATPPKKS